MINGVAPLPGINIDLVFLVVDILVVLLLLVGMESGFLQRHWTELTYKVKVDEGDGFFFLPPIHV